MTLLLTQYQIVRYAESSSVPAEIFKALPGLIGPLVWDSDKGPMENILGIVDLGLMIVPSGITQLIFVIGNVMGLDGSALGRYIDNALGLKGKDLSALANLDVESSLSKLTGIAKDDVQKLISHFKGSTFSSFKELSSPSSLSSVGGYNTTLMISEGKKRKKNRSSFEMTSVFQNAKFSPLLVIVALAGVLKWAVSLVANLVKLALTHPKTAILGTAAAAAGASVMGWFSEDEEGQEGANKTLKEEESIFSKEITNELSEKMKKEKSFGRILETLVNNVMMQQ